MTYMRSLKPMPRSAFDHADLETLYMVNSMLHVLHVSGRSPEPY